MIDSTQIHLNKINWSVQYDGGNVDHGLPHGEKKIQFDNNEFSHSKPYIHDLLNYFSSII